MLPVNKILERNDDIFESGSWLFINSPDNDVYSLCSDVSVTSLHQTLDTFLACTQQRQAFTFDSHAIATHSDKLYAESISSENTHIFAPYIDAGTFTDALIYMPKSKAQLAMLVHMAASRFGGNGSVYVVGENKSGIKSATKILAKYGVVNKIDSARHCSLLCLSISEPCESFSPDAYLSFNTYSFDHCTLQCATFPGIFSEGRLDEGTALLLNNASTLQSGHVLDFACGAGVIATYLMLQNDKISSDLSDVSAIALYCAAHTLEANGLQGKLIAADGLTGITAKYGGIITNPPFHTGVNTNYEIVTHFINDVVKHLRANAKLTLVANRFLPYSEQLEAAFTNVNVLAQTSRFSVYQSY